VSERVRPEVLALIDQALWDEKQTTPPTGVERKGMAQGEYE
jgi:hypothetical protein